MARVTWFFTVAGLSTSRSAMSSLDSPSPTRPTSCRSRSVSTSILAAGGGGLARSANSLISRRGTLGDSSASPVATPRPARLGRLGVLDQEAAGPGAQRLEHVLVQLERGQDDHLHSREPSVAGDLVRGLQPVQAGHPD